MVLGLWLLVCAFCLSCLCLDCGYWLLVLIVGYVCLVLGSWCLVLGVWCLFFGYWFLVIGFRFPGFVFRFLVLCYWFLVHGSLFLVLALLTGSRRTAVQLPVCCKNKYKRNSTIKTHMSPDLQ